MKREVRNTPAPRSIAGIEYDGVEIAACVRTRYGLERVESAEDIGRRKVACITVYVHLVGGGVHAVADCEDWAHARGIGALLARRTEYGVKDFYFPGAEVQS